MPPRVSYRSLPPFDSPPFFSGNGRIVVEVGVVAAEPEAGRGARDQAEDAGRAARALTIGGGR